VQVGRDATVLRGPGVADLEGVPSGDDGVILGVDGAAAEALADPNPQTSAITPNAQSAVQSCLGDVLAQTILGPAEMGSDAAVGVGLARSVTEPDALVLRICGAPRLIRHVHALEKQLQREFKTATVEEREIGEREIMTAVVDLDALPAVRALALLSAGPELRALTWR
jgi:hypothetical protein